VTFYQNGISTGTGTLSGVQNISPGIAVGATTSGANGWQGDVAEVLVYDHQLSDAELQQVTLYLGAKYGLAANGPAPVISPNGGSFSSTQSVAISTVISGATIHYTLDGTTPTPNSPTYSSAVSLSNSALVQAVAVSPTGIVQSQTARAQFYINDPDSTGLPPAPTSLTVTSTSPTQNSLSWTLTGTGTYNQIYIYRSINGGAYQLIAVLSGTSTTFMDSTVNDGNSYTYEVGTVNQSGVATGAASASVTPSSNGQLDIVVTTPSGATPLP
jgi:Chitobiase/beta-hexosaminidase C-terminal domain